MNLKYYVIQNLRSAAEVMDCLIRDMNEINITGLMLVFCMHFLNNVSVGEFLVHTLEEYGWSKEGCKGHYIGISKLVLFWIFKKLSTLYALLTDKNTENMILLSGFVSLLVQIS